VLAYLNSSQKPAMLMMMIIMLRPRPYDTVQVAYRTASVIHAGLIAYCVSVVL